jgi:hypothetical protein
LGAAVGCVVGLALPALPLLLRDNRRIAAQSGVRSTDKLSAETLSVGNL